MPRVFNNGAADVFELPQVVRARDMADGQIFGELAQNFKILLAQMRVNLNSGEKIFDKR